MESCGAELAESALVPELLSSLMQHVAENMEAHARWVGTASSVAAREQRALLDVAREYQVIAQAASRAATTLRGLQDLPAVPHDPAAWDREAFAVFLRKKIEIQRELGRLILDHAHASERVLANQVARE